MIMEYHQLTIRKQKENFSRTIPRNKPKEEVTRTHPINTPARSYRNWIKQVTNQNQLNPDDH